MTLPAHRFRDREDRKKAEPADKGDATDGPRIWSFDIDSTITAAPQQYARLATALKAQGDKIVCVTGHGPKHTRQELLDSLGFPCDEIIIVDPGNDGSGKAKALDALGAFMHFDDHVEFGPAIIKVCPVAFQYVEPPGDDHPKKAAKKAAESLKGKRSEQRSAAPPPPNLRVSTSAETDAPEHECGTCRMYDAGLCWGYGLFPVNGEWVCDSWSLDPNWQDQDAAQDAADGELNTP